MVFLSSSLFGNKIKTNKTLIIPSHRRRILFLRLSKVTTKTPHIWNFVQIMSLLKREIHNIDIYERSSYVPTCWLLDDACSPALVVLSPAMRSPTVVWLCLAGSNLIPG